MSLKRTAICLAVAAAALIAYAPPADAYTRISNERTVTAWAYVMKSTAVRIKPKDSSKTRAKLGTVTYLRHSEVVVVLGLEIDEEGTEWYRIRYPGIGNRLGWIRADALSDLRVERTQLVIDTRSRRLTLLVRGKKRFRAPVAVGAPSSPTPRGKYYVREHLFSRDPFYGPVAFGLSAYSKFRTQWPGGGQVGVHGTNQPQLIGRAVSNGCVRMKNADVLRLSIMLPLGTPVLIK